MNRICQLFGISFPVISGGMVWCSGWKLASSVSNSGGLGLIGAGSMHPEVLSEHIRQCRAATSLPFGVNIPLMYPNVEEIMHLVVREQVPVVFTSAGSPATWTPFLRSHGILVAHVVSNTRFAVKAAEAGVHALVAEGFEAGGHNGREETTTMVLLPLIRSAVDLPLMAAGGIASGEAILAAQALGADGVQIGSLFASTTESSAHPHFKQRITEAAEGDTLLMLKALAPVRMLRNPFFDQARAAELSGAGVEELKLLLGKGRAKKGMFEGDLREGQLEIGQVAAAISRSEDVRIVMERLRSEYLSARNRVCAESFTPTLE